MDYIWTPKTSRPAKLYRVYRPKQYTTLSHRGLHASDRIVVLPISTHFSQFISSITDHRMQSSRPSPYISFFSSRDEAENWALAAEDVFHAPSYILELDMTHKNVQNLTMWYVQDIQDKTGKPLGLGGVRNSEWMILWAVPGEAISREFTSSADIRRERRIPFPTYVENPNTARRDIPLFNEWLFLGEQNHATALKCGCQTEEKCIHFQWPFEIGVDKGESMKQIQAFEGAQVPGNLYRNSFDSGIDMGGHPVRADHQSSEDSGVAMGDEEASEGQPLPAKEKQGVAGMGNEGIQSPSVTPSLIGESHDLAKIALEAIRALNPAV
ncbi:hypothetical protein N431DRAFT_460810 [Stipitochalara longipes BDJ]|nr:hypothetical protein N431DRAFT_460810 [Stipitochalara longipes BDJ]